MGPVSGLTWWSLLNIHESKQNTTSQASEGPSGITPSDSNIRSCPTKIKRNFQNLLKPFSCISFLQHAQHYTIIFALCLAYEAQPYRVCAAPPVRSTCRHTHESAPAEYTALSRMSEHGSGDLIGPDVTSISLPATISLCLGPISQPLLLFLLSSHSI